MSEGVGTSSGRFWQDGDGPAVAGRSQSRLASDDDGVFQLDPSGAFVAVTDAPATATSYGRESRLQWAPRLEPKSGEGTTFRFTLLAGGEHDG